MERKNEKIINILRIILLCSISVFSLEMDLSDGVLTISGNGEIPQINSNQNYNAVKEIIVKEGITSIGNQAFANCYSLTSITIPNSVTYIGNEALQKVKINGKSNDLIIWKGKLISYNGNDKVLIIPNSVTSIGSLAFDGCSDDFYVIASDRLIEKFDLPRKK